MLKQYRTLSLLFMVAVNGLLFLSCGGGGGGGSNTSTSPTPAAPVITKSPVSQIVTEGQSATFAVAATGAAPLRYQWQRGAVKVGGDSESLSITSAKAENAGSYTVTVSNSAGNVTSNAATLLVTSANLAGDISFGVWLQSPTRMRDGKNNAQNYRDIGITTFIGLWEWPSETGMGGGYDLLAAKALKDAGMKAYAGNSLAAVDWINAHSDYSNTFVGYILGDEPDMNKVNGNPDDQPDKWKSNGEALRAADPTRELFANFGKGFALDPWVGYHIDPGSTQAADFTKYVSPLTVISSDLYGITDPWEAPSSHGIWAYGLAVSNTKRWAGARPVWGVLEASAPFKATEGSAANRMYQHMPASMIMPVVWEMVVHGATGFVYFCHDFSNGMIEDGALAEPGMPAAIKAANTSVAAFGSVLKSPSVPGTTVSTDGSVNVVALTKSYGGSTYIFAMADGNATYRDGKAVDAAIQVSGTRTGSVTVLSDSRTITMANGKISDHFEPYELHIYKY